MKAEEQWGLPRPVFPEKNMMEKQVVFLSLMRSSSGQTHATEHRRAVHRCLCTFLLSLYLYLHLTCVQALLAQLVRAPDF